MTISQIDEMLDLSKRSNLHSVVYGGEGIGKTSFCKDKFKNALIILNNELHDNNILFLKSAFEINPVIIFENVTNETLNFLLPILNNRTIMGRELKNFFIITAREKLEIPYALLIPFSSPSSSAWLEWAKSNQIHPAIIEAINHKDLLDRHKPRDLEALSYILNNPISIELLDPILNSFLDGDVETIDVIKANLQKNPSAINEPQNNSLNRFDIQGEFNNKKSGNSSQDDTLEHLKVLLDEPESEDELNTLLEKQDVRKIIDDALRRII